VPVDALPDYDPSFMKEGFLQKKGQRLKGWKRRWFVCDGRALSYYISRKDRKPNAVIPLEGCTVQDGGLSETWNAPRIYLTDGATGVMYCLSAEDAGVVTHWLAVLRKAVARVNGSDEASGSSDQATTSSARSRPKHASRPGATASTTEDVDASTNPRANYTRSISIDQKAAGAAVTAPRSTTLRSASSTSDVKRTTRIISAPSSSTNGVNNGVSSAAASHVGTGVTSRGPGRGKVQHIATTVALENELAHGLDVLEALLASNRHSNPGHGRHSAGNRTVVAFRALGARDGVLRSVGADSAGHEFARASVVLPVASETLALLLTDHAKRAEWDVQFSRSAHVASYDDTTDLVHLSIDRESQVTACIKSFVPPPLAGALCALGIAVISTVSSVSPFSFSALLGSLTWTELLSVMVYAGVVVGGALALVDEGAKFASAPRDLLLLRHVRESSVDNDNNHDEDDRGVHEELGQSIVLILEKSFESDLKPETRDVVRARVGVSGWKLEPVDAGTRTLATYVTDIDVGGWLSPETKRAFLRERVALVDVLREYVSQALLLHGPDLGFGGSDDDDDASVDQAEGNEASMLMDGDLDEGSITANASHQGQDPTMYHPMLYMRGMMPLPSGGLKLMDKEIAKKQGGVLKEVIKSAGAKILEGKSAVSLSLPVRIFEPRTNLERLCDLMLYAPTFLNRAADATDPLERMKLVLAFTVAGMHHSVGQLKPFNPILGETFQTLLNDGTEVCCEHTSHHPPISNFQFTGNKYSLAGFVLWHGSFSMKSNALINSNRGPIRVSFNDGTTIQYNLPYIQYGGFLWGDRTIEIMGTMTFEDKKNHLLCELKLNPDEKKGMGGMFSSSKTPSDHMRGSIVNTQTGAELAEVSGSWLHELRINDAQYWSIRKHQSGFLVPYPEHKLLPSDSRFREDRAYLASGDLDESQEWKVRLEVLQRADRKIRNEGRHPNHWSLKDGAAGH
jgi:hypothetical protein